VRETRMLGSEVGILRAVAGMIPPGAQDINPALNTIHSLVAVGDANGQWRAALFQSTPAAWHRRPGDSAALTEELRDVIRRGQARKPMTPEKRFELTTERCVLQPITMEDTRPLHELWSSAGVRRFLWDDEVIPIARTQAAIEQSKRLFGERSVGLWGARRHDAPNLIGFGGLWLFREPPELELLYGVAAPVWGQGYATEIAQAVTAYCFNSLTIPVVRASTDAANVASIRVLEKLGFGFVRRDVVGGLDTVFYELTRHGRLTGHH